MDLLQTRYGLMEVVEGDAGVSESLRQYGEWAERELQLMRRFISTGDHVLDIGSFIGTHALAFSQFVGQEGRVTAFEPRKEAFEILVRNTSKAGNINCIKAALSHQHAWFELHEMDPSSVQNFGGLALGGGDRNGARYFVEARVLDDYDFARLDFLKIDVEGMEADVLRGGRSQLIKFRPRIFLECNSVDASSGVLVLAKELGFHVYGSVGPAFNNENWAANQRDIFGGCAEASLILLPAESVTNFDVTEFRRIQTLDDVVSLLLRKPQYPAEILNEIDGPAAGVQELIRSADLQKLLTRTERLLEEKEQGARELVDRNASLERRIAEFHAKARMDEARKADELARVNAKVSSARREIVSSRSQLSRLQAEMLELHGQLHAIQAQLHATRASLSWRVTAPIRGLSGRFPGLMRRIRTTVQRHPKLRRAVAGALRGNLRVVRPVATPLEGSASGGSQAAIPPTFHVDVKREVLARAEPAQEMGRRILCVGHFSPFPPRAGNELRVNRMLAWLESRGHDSVVIIAPLPGEAPGESQIELAFRTHPQVIFVLRDGSIRANFAEARAWLASLEGKQPRDFAQVLGEGDFLSLSAEAIKISRTFCSDALIEVVLLLSEKFNPGVLLAQYCFMTRVFPLLKKDIVKIVDTHDVFSTKTTKVAQYGIDNVLILNEQDESTLLQRADVVIGIQQEEASLLREMLPETRVICAGTDFLVEKDFGPPPGNGVAIMVGSANPMNLKGLRDFLRFAWPVVRRDHPHAVLQVVGDVGKAVDAAPEGVHVLGRVDDLRTLYAGADVVVNPTVAGTGLKIKTVEGLCHLRKVVTFCAGIEGIGPEGRSYVDVATNWYEFSVLIGRALDAAKEGVAVPARATALAAELSPERVYGELAEVLNVG